MLRVTTYAYVFGYVVLRIERRGSLELKDKEVILMSHEEKSKIQAAEIKG